MIFPCLKSNSNFSLQIQTFSNVEKVVQIKPNQISNVKFKSNSNQTSFEAFPSFYFKFYVTILGYHISSWFSLEIHCLTFLLTCSFWTECVFCSLWASSIYKLLTYLCTNEILALTMCSLIDAVTITNFFSDRH